MSQDWENTELQFSDIWCRGSNMSDLPLVQVCGDKGILILRALSAGLELKILYAGPEVCERKVRPEAVAKRASQYGDVYYLLAYCKLRHDYRTFRISQILDIELTGEEDPPSDFVIQTLDKFRRDQKRQLELLTQSCDKLKAEKSELASHNRYLEEENEGLEEQNYFLEQTLRRRKVHTRILYGIIGILVVAAAGAWGYAGHVRNAKACSTCVTYKKKIADLYHFIRASGGIAEVGESPENKVTDMGRRDKGQGESVQNKQ